MKFTGNMDDTVKYYLKSGNSVSSGKNKHHMFFLISGFSLLVFVES